MRSSPTWILLAGLMLLLDFYVFQIIKTVSHSAGPRTRAILFGTYWTLSVLSLVLLFLLPLFESLPRNVRSILFAVIVGLFLCKLVASVFFLVDDLRRGIQWLAAKLFFRDTEGEEMPVGDRMSRSLFLSWLGLGAGAALYGAFLLGFSNKYNYKVRKVQLRFPNLPAAFRGLKIVQLSDIHSGSFTDSNAVAKGIEKVLSLQPDLILFTGDLVNNTADELEPYTGIFSKLQAPLGVYSVLGNHDYGDYVAWDSLSAKRQNLDRLKSLQQSMGWKLLVDEHVRLERNGEAIGLIGIQNWSALGRFPKYGNLSRAYEGAGALPFKILMSHDPTHWDAEVRARFPDIDLTLAGHTHGMQFGVENPWFRWSPVQYVYRQWMGLYEEGAQKLYVNRGFGFIGYPGRVGILPEITLLELA
jgi:predicted MPP superfamily phosphohydrolase